MRVFIYEIFISLKSLLIIDFFLKRAHHNIDMVIILKWARRITGGDCDLLPILRFKPAFVGQFANPLAEGPSRLVPTMASLLTIVILSLWDRWKTIIMCIPACNYTFLLLMHDLRLNIYFLSSPDISLCYGGRRFAVLFGWCGWERASIVRWLLVPGLKDFQYFLNRLSIRRADTLPPSV